jgi:hypothetical protein
MTTLLVFRQQNSGDARGVAFAHDLWRRSKLIHYFSSFFSPLTNCEFVYYLYGFPRLELSTSDLSQQLCEELRMILEPTLSSKLQGDYRTGLSQVVFIIAQKF